MRLMLTCALMLATAAPVRAQEAGETTDTPALPLFEEWAERTEGLMRELMQDLGPEMGEFMAQIIPRLQQLTDAVGGLVNYEMPEMLPNGDIIIRRKEDAPPLPPDFMPDNDPIDL